MSSEKKLAIKGAFWTIASYGSSQIIRFGSNLILTRLLLPELFGLMGLAYVFITAVHLFTDIGLGPSIIQNKRGEEPEFLNTAWTMQVIRSVFIWFCLILITWPVATFYQEPRLLWLIPVISITTLIGGFKSTSVSILERKMTVKNVVIFELVIQIVSTAVMIVWAWFDRSIWAILVGGFVGSIVELVWSHFLIPGHSNRFAWERDAVKEIFSYGKWIFLSTVLFFLCSQADRLVLGKIFSLTMLGIYGIAFTLGDMPRQVIIALAGRVIFPSISMLADLPREELRAKIIKNRNLILIPLALGLAIFVSFGDQLILTLYRKEYMAASWMMPILALGIWHTTLHSLMGSCLLAIGKSQYAAMGNLATFLSIAIGIPVGYHFMGNLGAVIAVAVGDIPTYLVVTYGLRKEGLTCFWEDMKLTAMFLGTLAIILLVRKSLGGGLPIDRISPEDIRRSHDIFVTTVQSAIF
ncbi:MAG: oligosaccharide flippase family protein [Microcoleus sp. PH2017_10_PVI_O_A]|uniref:oligosaccharide flippase family protein n=1 Tax=unclassified Microcoleus TaxID=2642155 RepID=UPI001D401E93|nr:MULTISPECIES: oligosaccharide flippase family protein [unclassified Microcoleus]TAE84754.1 MAG: polysaccharide biosynthesis protein [Oscillatoriales cyanobacterium]MCC3405014.1 oligosaccharide flippase family protein [Microcoleus sp. PH2017_10_PVI_O_A]MCC3458965.1 oligosaccharide flippase family protein [Microcoleus sp. PH2017_11_PCY_U_A]MCC3477798.1 oligosaccharide flippase family protein [Microcoleus sp. PH2017_12_PCY_D_A]MCC3527741.1 oligosaccharide flippase family protein [Microcoleus s